MGVDHQVSEWIVITLLWILLYGYLIVASVDFGAGFFASYENISGERHGMTQIINRFLSPFWELVSVLVLILLIAGVCLYSAVARQFGAMLLLPSFTALILMVLRVLFYWLKASSKWCALGYGLTGLIVPVVLSSMLTISEGGYLSQDNGQIHLKLSSLATSFYSWSVIILSIVSVLYISAMFLIFYADRVGDEMALEKLRGYGLFWSGPTVLASALVFVALQAHNSEHFMNSLNVAWLFLLSLVCLLIAVTLVFRKRRLGLSFVFVALQYLFAFFGYGISHLPYVIYPYIKLNQITTLKGTGGLFIFALIIGVALLLPSLILVSRLVIFNRHLDRFTNEDDPQKNES